MFSPLFFCKNVAFQSGHTGGGHLIGVALDIIDNPPPNPHSLAEAAMVHGGGAERRVSRFKLVLHLVGRGWIPRRGGPRRGLVNNGGGAWGGRRKTSTTLFFNPPYVGESSRATHRTQPTKRGGEEGWEPITGREERRERGGKLRADVPICQVNGWPDASSN